MALRRYLGVGGDGTGDGVGIGEGDTKDGAWESLLVFGANTARSTAKIKPSVSRTSALL